MIYIIKHQSKVKHGKKAKELIESLQKTNDIGKNNNNSMIVPIATGIALVSLLAASIYKVKRSKKVKTSTVPRSKVIDKEENGNTSEKFSVAMPEESNNSPEKFPVAVSIVLAVLCFASITTGVIYWYNAYLRPVETVAADLAPFEMVYVPEEPLGEAPYEEYLYKDEYEYIYEEYQEDVPPRPEVDPMPEFVALWEEFERNDIVARLVIAGEEILTVQGGEVPYGWLLLDEEVDLLMGFDHNMVVYASDEGDVREILREYLDYEFFLQYPTLLFSTMYGDFDWEIFSFYVAPAGFPFAVVNHPSDEEWGDILEEFTILSMYNTMLDVMQYDQILTIIAPTDIPDLYYVLQARMLRLITS